MAARGVPPLVGHALVQLPVLTEHGESMRLDDVLGPGFAVLAVDVGAAGLAALADPVWDLLAVRRVELALDDRQARPSGPWRAAADEHGLLATELAPARGRLVLVRPDKYIAAVVEPSALADFTAWLRDQLASATVTEGSRAADGRIGSRPTDPRTS